MVSVAYERFDIPETPQKFDKAPIRLVNDYDRYGGRIVGRYRYGARVEGRAEP